MAQVMSTQIGAPICFWLLGFSGAAYREVRRFLAGRDGFPLCSAALATRKFQQGSSQVESDSGRWGLIIDGEKGRSLGRTVGVALGTSRASIGDVQIAHGHFARYEESRYAS